MHRTWTKSLCSIFALAMLFGAVGCGGPEYAEVEGVVTRDNKPLKDVQVVFMPDPELGTFGPSSRAFTDEEGRYSVTSVRGRDGAVVGTHRVCIRDITVLMGGKPRVPPAYSNSTATPFRNVEVTSGKQTHDFELK